MDMDCSIAGARHSPADASWLLARAAETPVSQQGPRGAASAPHGNELHHHHAHAALSHHPGGHHLLTVEDLTVAFDMYDPAAPFFRAGRVRSEVLHSLALSVHAGEILAVVGASGSGKTVLADALLGLFEPNSEVRGRIWFDGKPQTAESLKTLRGHGISLVPQSVNHLDPVMRVGEQVRGIARMVDEDKYCIDILTQVAAVSKALHAVSLNLLEEHIGHCVTGAAVESERTGDPTIAEAKVKEAAAAISRLMRS